MAGLLFLFSPGFVFPQPSPASTSDVFKKFEQGVVQVRVLEKTTGIKSVLGSGFFITTQGHVATNYHVISFLVYKPEEYEADIVFSDNTTAPARLVDFDVVHDLAILKTDRKDIKALELNPDMIEKGTRVFAMGNPHDLGLTIVEGTHSGFIEKSLTEKIHFTGSLNPGMSGGPALVQSGKVVGINVSTAGNQVSFLVPVKYLSGLMEHLKDAPLEDAETALSRLQHQLSANQDVLIPELAEGLSEKVRLGEFDLPGQCTPALNCWSGVKSGEEDLFRAVSYSCSSDNDIFLSGTHYTGSIQYVHTFFSSEELNRFRFYSLYESSFESGFLRLSGYKEDVANFSCTTGFVDINGLSFKVVSCLRAYKKLPGLYDFHLKAACLYDNHKGLMTQLTLSGVTSENAAMFGKRFLESIQWRK